MIPFSIKSSVKGEISSILVMTISSVVTISFGSSGFAISTNDLLSLIEKIQRLPDMAVSRENPNESVLNLPEVDMLSSYM